MVLAAQTIEGEGGVRGKVSWLGRGRGSRVYSRVALNVSSVSCTKCRTESGRGRGRGQPSLNPDCGRSLGFDSSSLRYTLC